MTFLYSPGIDNYLEPKNSRENSGMVDGDDEEMLEFLLASFDDNRDNTFSTINTSPVEEVKKSETVDEILAGLALTRDQARTLLANSLVLIKFLQTKAGTDKDESQSLSTVEGPDIPKPQSLSTVEMTEFLMANVRAKMGPDVTIPPMELRATEVQVAQHVAEHLVSSCNAEQKASYFWEEMTQWKRQMVPHETVRGAFFLSFMRLFELRKQHDAEKETSKLFNDEHILQEAATHKTGVCRWCSYKVNGSGNLCRHKRNVDGKASCLCVIALDVKKGSPEAIRHFEETENQNNFVALENDQTPTKKRHRAEENPTTSSANKRRRH